MIRYLTVLVLLAAFAAQTFNQAVIVLEYYINTTSFAKNCENKARAELHCEGKCQMLKKINEEKQSNPNPTGPSLPEPYINQLVFVQHTDELDFLYFADASKYYYDHYLLKSYTSPVFPFFHPPGV
jgi:hypothetical protein